jgi:acyl-CoA dehydrogenase
MSPPLRSSLDLPFFEETHRERAGAFTRWVAQHLSAFVDAEGGDGSDARRIFEALGAAGWLDLTASATSPATSRAPDLRHVCLMREALAYSSAIADVAFSEPWLAALPLILAGNDRQCEHLLPAYTAGRTLLAFALSEPEAGSDVAAICTRATRVPGGHRIDGRKTWTSNAGLADGYVVFARGGDEAGKAGISAFLVEGGAAGVELVERIRVLSPHTVGTLAFNQCEARDPDSIVGPEGSGFDLAMRALALFRPTVAAACVGFARRALDEALKRCSERVTFGRPIAQHQLIQAKLADMAVRINAAALLTYHAAWSADRGGEDAAVLGAMAKLHASEAAQAVVDEAVQIFGGLGVAHGQVVERLYRHVRAFRIFDGTSEIQKLVIARRLLSEQHH